MSILLRTPWVRESMHATRGGGAAEMHAHARSHAMSERSEEGPRTTHPPDRRVLGKAKERV